MIVIPRLLTEVLRTATEPHAKRLVVAFAGHVVPETGPPADLLRALTGFLDGGPVAELVEARREFFARQDECGDEWQVAHLALRVVGQRELEAHGAVHRYRFQPDVVDVAKEAQRLAGTGWEESRWQLVQAIATAPAPT